MNQLEVGSTINIERSDGRIHPAIVATINDGIEIVGVEWFEAGETKGKEIEFQCVVALNPHITSIRRENPRLSERLADVTSAKNSNKLLLKRQSIAGFNSRCQTPKSRTTNNYNPSIVGGIKRKQEKLLQSSSSVIEPTSFDTTAKKAGRLELERIERRKEFAENKLGRVHLIHKNADNPYWELQNMIAEHCKNIDYQPLSIINDSIQDRLITVCVRKRPLNKLELGKKEIDVITIPSKNQLIVHEPKIKVDLTKYLDNHLYKFDYTFNEKCTNKIVYQYTAQPLIKTIFEGGFATCFAYGQTGSGKTFTMSGDTDKNSSNKGIYAMAATDVFRLVVSPQYKHLDLIVTCSFFEIYSKKVLDLLNHKSDLKILEDGKQQVQVIGLTEKVVSSVVEVLNLIQRGNTARTSGQTSANENSSRSHAIFQIFLRQAKKVNVLYGKFSLIDLAGNERGADTLSSTKETRMEGGEINKSLLALKECIRALARKGAHLPFRLSKLTQVLRDSFIGRNSKTCMIAMVSPGVSSCENTLNTLRYADRVKELGGGDVQQLNTIHERNNELTGLTSEEELIYQKDNIVQRNMMKDKVAKFHRATIDRLQNITIEAKSLLKSIDDDTETYCRSFENFLDDSIEFFLNVKNYVVEYKRELRVDD